HGDDKSRLEHHQRNDQPPSEITLKGEIIDGVGAGTEDEQPAPDDEVKLYRMLLALGMHNRLSGCGVPMQPVFPRFCLCHRSTSPKIEEREDENPYQIDEMPVEPHDLDALILAAPAGEEAGRTGFIIAAPHLAGDDQQ